MELGSDNHNQVFHLHVVCAGTVQSCLGQRTMLDCGNVLRVVGHGPFLDSTYHMPAVPPNQKGQRDTLLKFQEKISKLWGPCCPSQDHHRYSQCSIASIHI